MSMIHLVQIIVNSEELIVNNVISKTNYILVTACAKYFTTHCLNNLSLLEREKKK